MTAPKNKPVPPDVLERFLRYYKKNPTWGSLHIVLEDFNMADGHVNWCINNARQVGDQEGEALGHLLLTMSKSQRFKLARWVEV
ncbi:hypothetical protein Aura_00110 [Pseudomonas phage vB_PpuM-Aura]